VLVVDVAAQGPSDRGRYEVFTFGGQAGVFVLPASSRGVLTAIFAGLQPETEIGATSAAAGGRISVAFLGRDQRTYRVARQLGAAGARLGREAPGEPRLLSNHVGEVAQYLRLNLGVPAALAYERLFWWSPERIGPSAIATRAAAGSSLFGRPRRSTGGLGPEPTPPSALGAGFGGGLGGPPLATLTGDLGGPMSGLGVASGLYTSALDVGAAPRAGSGFHATNALVREELETSDLVRRTRESPEVMRRELAAIRMRRARIAEVRAGDVERERLRSEREALVALVERHRALTVRLANLDAALAPHRELLEIAGELGERVEAFRASQARRAAELERLAAERAAFEAERTAARTGPLARDPAFVAGLALSVLLAVVGLVAGRRAPWLLHLVGTFVAAGAALQWVDRRGAAERVGARERSIEERRARVERQWELETAVVRRLIAAYEVDAPSALTVRAEEAARLRVEYDAAEVERSLLDADPALADATRRVAGLDARLRALEEQEAGLVAELGELPSLAELDRRAGAIERALAGFERTSVPPLALPSFAPRAPATPTTDLDGDPSPALSAAAAELLDKRVDALGSLVDARLGRYIAALTRGVVSRATLDDEGRMILDDGSGLTSLLGDTRIVAELALRTCLVELAIARTPLPLLVEDPVAPLGAEARRRVVDLLGHLGRIAMVIVTSDATDLGGTNVVPALRTSKT
jgi:hypothetical protein